MSLASMENRGRFWANDAASEWNMERTTTHEGEVNFDDQNFEILLRGGVNQFFKGLEKGLDGVTQELILPFVMSGSLLLDQVIESSSQLAAEVERQDLWALLRTAFGVPQIIEAIPNAFRMAALEIQQKSVTSQAAKETMTKVEEFKDTLENIRLIIVQQLTIESEDEKKALMVKSETQQIVGETPEISTETAPLTKIVNKNIEHKKKSKYGLLSLLQQINQTLNVFSHHTIEGQTSQFEKQGNTSTLICSGPFSPVAA